MKTRICSVIIPLLFISSCEILWGYGDHGKWSFNGSTIISCPTGYIRVPADSTVGTTADFCVAKFEMKDDGSGNAVSQAAGVPWVNIDWADAVTECDDLNALNGVTSKYALISNEEWMTVARNVEQVDANWFSGTAGVGVIARGHSDNFPATGLAGSTDDDGYANTVNDVTEPINGGREQRRKEWAGCG